MLRKDREGPPEPSEVRLPILGIKYTSLISPSFSTTTDSCPRLRHGVRGEVPMFVRESKDDGGEVGPLRTKMPYEGKSGFGGSIGWKTEDVVFVP